MKTLGVRGSGSLRACEWSCTLRNDLHVMRLLMTQSNLPHRGVRMTFILQPWQRIVKAVLPFLFVWFFIPAGTSLAVQHTETEKVLITQIGCHSTPKTSGEGICFIGLSGPVPNPAAC